jgi:hypothetical protein
MPRLRLTYANVVSTLCLVLLVGAGTAHAAGVAANSVGSLQIKNGSIAKADVGRNAVDSARVQNDSLTGADVRESTLRGVDAARVGGMQVQKIARRQALETPEFTLFRSTEYFRLVAGCDFTSTLTVVGERNGMVVSISSTRADATDDNDDTTDVVTDVTYLDTAETVDVELFADTMVEIVVSPTGGGPTTKISVVDRNYYGDPKPCRTDGFAFTG